VQGHFQQIEEKTANYLLFMPTQPGVLCVIYFMDELVSSRHLFLNKLGGGKSRPGVKEGVEHWVYWIGLPGGAGKEDMGYSSRFQNLPIGRAAAKKQRGGVDCEI
jgi:hypothetical protein